MSKSEIRIEFNSPGFQELLESEEVRELLVSNADAAAARMSAMKGGNFAVELVEAEKVDLWGGRYVAHVTAADQNALLAASEDKVMEKGLFE